MEKPATFGNVELVQIMLSRFGEVQKPVKAEMSYAAEVESFLSKVDEAHRLAATSTLVFG
jgi:hypothetical protein